MQRCKQCGAKVIRFPIWEGQEDGVPFSWDKLILINLFKVELITIIFFISIIVLMLGYKADMAQCKDAIERPCEFCETTNCCQVEWGRVNPSQLYNATVDIRDIPDIN